jgi:uncharacterized cofD-like protein
MSAQVAVLGGGHGVSAVLRALRDDGLALTAIVTIADDGGSSGRLRRQWGGPGVGDMRRSLIALTGEKSGAGRALAGPVAIARVGRHPLGNLMLHSLGRAFGDLEAASEWLTEQLGVSARVLPATSEPVTLIAAAGGALVRGESAIGAAEGRIAAIRFEPQRPQVPSPVIDAITRADWVLLGPGSLFTSVLAVGALPDVRSALAGTRARVLWICNLVPEVPETAGMSADDHLSALRSHEVRVDAVLYDPSAALHFTEPDLAAAGLPGLPYELMSVDRGKHDPVLLSAALGPLLTTPARRESGRSPREHFSEVRPMGRAPTRCEIGIGDAHRDDFREQQRSLRRVRRTAGVSPSASSTAGEMAEARGAGRTGHMHGVDSTNRRDRSVDDRRLGRPQHRGDQPEAPP